MTRLRHQVVIDRPLTEVYSLARQVERYPEFLPGYLESRIIDRQGERELLQRTAVLRGRLKQWKSWASFRPNQSILFEHAEGSLKGMRAQWTFHALTANRTQLTIEHVFRITEPPGWGWVLEKLVYKPAIHEIASQVVQAFKKACEAQTVSLTRSSL